MGMLGGFSEASKKHALYLPLNYENFKYLCGL